MKVNVPKDTAWIKNRQQLWDDVWDIHLRSDPETKAEKKVSDALKYWYLEGDLTPLLACPNNDEKSEALRLSLIIQLCPITEVEPFVVFLQDYCLWASKNKVSYWGDNQAKRDERFISHFLTVYLGENHDTSNSVFEYMLKSLLPNEDGYSTFPLTLGKDKWQPKTQLALCDVGKKVLGGVRSYLFDSKAEFHLYQHVMVALPYIKYIKDLDAKYFDKVIEQSKPSRPKPPPEPLHVTGAGQKSLRAALGNLLGYKNSYNLYDGPLRHNDLSFEQKLQDLLAETNMPREYDELLKFIHMHKENYKDYSEG
ncbi:hypothetical protein [Colwellia echini]|uniref:Uncharacterized protein n=1 Tax=Colwellia echini TaxID=1982103 RepID=A0ABY3MXR3_9GAMM|nr:hypothetical protein [Colwellia echini]TYK66015.1 hypothetical protein CWS31_007005 [Colwellia echini]